MAYCTICAEPLTEPSEATTGICVLCAHRTTPTERLRRRLAGAGVIDSA